MQLNTFMYRNDEQKPICLRKEKNAQGHVAWCN